jgi:hypothetical protein
MKILNIYCIAGALLLLASASCVKELTKANVNPTASTANNYDPNLLLTEVQLNYCGSQAGENWATEWGGLGGFIQQTASLDGFYPGDKYLNNVSGYGQYFDQQYTASVQPVVELYQLTKNQPQYYNLHQIARLMKALVFERITDLYGDVPYFQAGLGYYDRIYAPAFDTQQSIYTDLLKEVSQATDSLSLSADYPTGDIFYFPSGSSQITEWKKFGNSLLLRMAMRLTKVDPATAQSYIAKLTATAGLTMTSNADNAIVEHSGQSNETFNRDAQTILGNDSSGLKLCKTFIDTLKKNKDPRLHVIAYLFENGGNSDTTSADQVGMPGGCILGGTNPKVNIAVVDSPYFQVSGIQGYSTLNSNVLNISAPTLVLTYAQTELLLADAAARWGSMTDAVTHYNNGVVAAITQLSAYGSGATISVTDAGGYLADHPLNTSSPATALAQINYEYWISCFMDEYEAWCNWRRTDMKNTQVHYVNPQGVVTNQIGEGYPTLYPTHYPGNVTNSTIPRRLNYPTDQQVQDAAAYRAALARMGGSDLLTNRMWWDVDN